MEPTKNIGISGIIFEDFVPFKDQHVVFETVNTPGLADLHVLTGGNGAGKTRLLSLLAASLGGYKSLGRRRSANEASSTKVISGLDLWGENNPSNRFRYKSVSINKEGMFVLSQPGILKGGSLSKSQKGSPSLSAHLALAFRGNASIRNTEISAMAGVDLGTHVERLDFDRDPSNENAMLNQAIANITISSAMETSDIGGKPGRYSKIKTALENTISEITGRQFRLYIQQSPEPQNKIKWGDDILLFDSAPDGLRSILGWLASCVTKLVIAMEDSKAPLEEPFFLLLDEPELHLHPEWQWAIIPAAQRLFPNAQIFVATHSPFVVASVNDGWIYKLNRGADDQVVIEKERAKAGDTFVDAAEDVLGVTSWFDPENRKLMQEFKKRMSAVITSGKGLEKLEKDALGLAKRGDSVRHWVESEMAQFRRQMPEKNAKA